MIAPGPVSCCPKEGGRQPSRPCRGQVWPLGQQGSGPPQLWDLGWFRHSLGPCRNAQVRCLSGGLVNSCTSSTCTLSVQPALQRLTSHRHARDVARGSPVPQSGWGMGRGDGQPFLGDRFRPFSDTTVHLGPLDPSLQMAEGEAFPGFDLAHHQNWGGSLFSLTRRLST